MLLTIDADSFFASTSTLTFFTALSPNKSFFLSGTSTTAPLRSTTNSEAPR